MAIVSSLTNHCSLPNDKGEERLVGSGLLKDEIKYTFDEETLEELVDNITATDPIVYNTNGGKSWVEFYI